MRFVMNERAFYHYTLNTHFSQHTLDGMGKLRQ